jgi:hypothetical protein
MSPIAGKWPTSSASSERKLAGAVLDTRDHALVLEEIGVGHGHGGGKRIAGVSVAVEERLELLRAP